MNLIEPGLPYADILEHIRACLPGSITIHLVGGAVRDLLLNRATHDLDFVLPGDAIATSRRVAKYLKAPFYPIDPERDTGRIMVADSLGKRLVLDFAAYRGPDLESDLRGRDFTINAIAIDLRQPHSLFDPLGGSKDLRSGVLRACSDTAFLSDPVRILRAVRQAVDFSFQIPPETHKLIRQALTGLSQISPERVRDELFRILDGPKPASALRTLDVLGALDFVLPELSVTKGCDQPPPHTNDVWDHSLNTAQQLANIIGVLETDYDFETGANLTMGLISLRLGRFREILSEYLSKSINPERSMRSLLLMAALYHDTGKPSVRQIDDDGRIHFRGHERISEQLTVCRGEALHLSTDEIERLRLIVRNHMRPILLAQTTLVVCSTQEKPLV